jgi:L-histidine Nalpha-methyltransferase
MDFFGDQISQMKMTKQLESSVFERDVKEGLFSIPKKLSSKYFYDKKGNQLFRQIMELDEYYLPKAEIEILINSTAKIAQLILPNRLDILELGAGDGSKTLFFLQNLIQQGKTIKYLPMDISAHILEINKSNLLNKISNLDIEPIVGDYFQTMEILSEQTNTKVVLFLGSNIGNYKGDEATEFLSMVLSLLHSGDFLLMGVDLRKNPKTILAAYNDSKGLTRQFNLNLLQRINDEMGADFDLTAFDHYPYYDPDSGIAYSYLVSLVAQKVTLDDGTTIFFDKNELIHTEYSQKYSLEELDLLGQKVGFSKVTHFTDQKDYFSISLFEK